MQPSRTRMQTPLIWGLLTSLLPLAYPASYTPGLCSVGTDQEDGGSTNGQFGDLVSLIFDHTKHFIPVYSVPSQIGQILTGKSPDANGNIPPFPDQPTIAMCCTALSVSTRFKGTFQYWKPRNMRRDTGIKYDWSPWPDSSGIRTRTQPAHNGLTMQCRTSGKS